MKTNTNGQKTQGLLQPEISDLSAYRIKRRKMVSAAMIRNWIIIGGLSFLVIGGGLIVAHWVGAKNIPVVSSVANGAVSFWKLAAA